MNSYQQGAPYHDTHSKVIGYLLWIFGFTGSHRFYYGKPITGTIWFFTLGLLGIGWLIDLFLIPSMDCLAPADIPGHFWRASPVPGQMDHRHHLLLYRRAVPGRCAV